MRRIPISRASSHPELKRANLLSQHPRKEDRFMPEHLLAEDIARFRNRAMPPGELIHSYGHLAACEACRRRVAVAAQPQKAFSSMLSALKAEEPEHLLYEQVASYVDDELAEVDREIVTSHLESCLGCEERVEQLRAFRAEMAACTEEGQSPQSGQTFWRKFVSFWRPPAHRIPLQLAATAAVILFCVWVATGPLRARVSELQAERDRLQRENDDLQKKSFDLQARLADIQQTRPPMAPQTAPQNLIALNDGGRQITLNTRGEIAGLESLPPSYEQAVKDALTRQRIDTQPELAELIGQSRSLMRGTGQGVAFALVSPVGAVVENERPTFRWREFSGASGYLVNVFDSRFNRVATSELISQTMWRIPGSLERGQTYTWQVTAIKDGERIKSPTTPAPEARFKVLNASEAAELRRMREKYYNSHLLLGVLYARPGLLDDAEREFHALASANSKSVVAKNRLSNIEAVRRR